MANSDTEISMIEGLDDRYLMFNMDGAYYGIPLAVSLEILTIQHITHLPCVSSHIKGIINLRGKVIPVLDIRAKLGIQEREYDNKTCIIIIELHDMCIGLIVDMVSEVITVSKDQIIAPPKNSANYIASVIQLGDKLVLNLDCEAFFQKDLEKNRIYN